MIPAPNDLMSPRKTPVRAEDMKLWAELLHDPNPIHLDPNAVRARGLGDRVINQGPANTALLIDLLLTRFPAARITTIEFRFLDNLFAGDIATAEGTITEVERADGELRIACTLRLHVDERAILSGVALFSLPSPNTVLESVS